MNLDTYQKINQHSDNLFTLDAKLAKNPIGRRMTVIRLKNNELALHSPVFLEGKIKSSLDELGQVAYILVPNEWHTLDTKKVHDQYPESKIMVPFGLRDRLAIKFPVSGTYDKDWTAPISEELDVFSVNGLKKPEVVFFHYASKTLIVADLFFNFNHDDFSGITKFLMNFNQATRFNTTRFYQWSMIKNKSEFRASLDEMNKKWDIDKVIMGHGHIVDANGRQNILSVIQNFPNG